MVKNPAVNSKESALDSLTTVTKLIKNYISSIESTKNELAKQKEMLEDALDNNPQYKEACDEAKEYSKIKADVKRQIMEEANLMELSQKVKELTAAVKESKMALSEYLVEYEKLSGSKQIESEKGETLEIVYTAKLVKPQPNFPK